jgi:hypothetical protein
MGLTLTDEEEELLVNILEQRRREILKEISHTDHYEFKEILRKNDGLIESILTHLREDRVHAARA